MRRLTLLVAAALTVAPLAIGRAETVPLPGLDPGAADRIAAGLPVALRLGGRALTLRTERREMLAAGTRPAVRTAAGERPAPAADLTAYRGRVDGMPGAVVALSVRDGVRGLIVGPTGAGWSLSPRGDGGAAARPFARLAHPPFGEGDGVAGPPAEPPAGPPAEPPADEHAAGAAAPAPPASPLRFRLALDVDYAYVTAYPDWQQNVVDVVNVVAALYEAQLGIRWEIASLTGWETLDPYRSTTACGQAGIPGPGKLDELRAYWQANRATVVRDAVHLVTGENLEGGYIGCAYINAVRNSNAYGVSRFYAAVSDAWLYHHVCLVAHEIGHNFGGLHERSVSTWSLAGEQLSGGTIMNPVAANNILRFSELWMMGPPLLGRALDNAGPMRAYAAGRLPPA